MPLEIPPNRISFICYNLVLLVIIVYSILGFYYRTIEMTFTNILIGYFIIIIGIVSNVIFLVKQKEDL
jgi:hypothetical protein